MNEKELKEAMLEIITDYLYEDDKYNDAEVARIILKMLEEEYDIR